MESQRPLNEKSSFDILNEEYQELRKRKEDLEAEISQMKKAFIEANQENMAEIKSSSFARYNMGDYEVLTRIINFKPHDIPTYDKWKGNVKETDYQRVKTLVEEESDPNQQSISGYRASIYESDTSEKAYNENYKYDREENAQQPNLMEKILKKELVQSIAENQKELIYVEINIDDTYKKLKKSYQDIILSNIPQILKQKEFWEKQGKGRTTRITLGFIETTRTPESVTDYKKIFDKEPLNIKELYEKACRKQNEHVQRERKDPTDKPSDATKELTNIIVACFDTQIWKPEHFKAQIEKLYTLRAQVIPEQEQKISSGIQYKRGSDSNL